MGVFSRHRSAVMRWACLLGVLLLLFSLAAGCGTDADPPPEEEAVNGEEEVEEGVEAAEDEGEEGLEDILANWENPRSFEAFAGNFEELKYRFESNGTSETIHYTLGGKETVGGVEATKISLNFIEGGTNYSWWVDDEGGVLRLDMDGEIIEGELAEMAGESLMMMAFLPYFYVEDFQARDVLAGNYPGYSVREVDRKSEQFGDSRAEVYTLEVTVGPPLAEEEVSVRWSVGDFGDFSMLVGWEAAEHVEGTSFSYQLLELNPLN